MSQNSQLLSLQVGEGTWEGSGSSQQCASGGFWLQRPPWGCLQLEHSGPGKGSPCSLEEAPRDQAPEGCRAQDHPIPPLHSGSPWDSSSFSSLCCVISRLFPSSPHQAKLRKVTYNKNNGLQGSVRALSCAISLTVLPADLCSPCFQYPRLTKRKLNL